MAKHIKLKAELSKDQKSVTAQLLEQTHFGEKFGNVGVQPGERSRGFTHGRITLYSHACVDNHKYFPFKQNGPVWLLLATAPYHVGSGKNLVFTVEEWQEVRAAVLEYNKWGDSQ